MTWEQGVGWRGEGEEAGFWKEGEAEGEVEQMVDLYVHVGMQELLYACMHAFTRCMRSDIHTTHKYGTSF